MDPDSGSHSQWTIEGHGGQTIFTRPLGASEYAYYVPAKDSGIGDMFLHTSFSVSPENAQSILDPERVAKCWATLRRRNPLLMTRVVQIEGEPWFWFTPPPDSIQEAKESITFVDGLSRDELISSYLNGSRTLSDEKMSYLVISRPANANTEQKEEGTYSLLFCAPHYIGDGSSLHQCTHELFVLLTNSDLSAPIEQDKVQWIDRLPPPLESRLPIPTPGKWKESKLEGKLTLSQAAAKITYLKGMWSEIGAHTLQRFPLGSARNPQKTLLVERSFSVEQTKKILQKCKQHGVTINHALFALCGIAWRQTHPQKEDVPMPIMMYTALNLRPYLTSVPRALPSNEETTFFLALTYFNIVLPSFPIAGISDVNSGLIIDGEAFWNRAKEAKRQVRKITGNSSGKANVDEIHKAWLGYRALTGAMERAERVRSIVRAQTTQSQTRNLGTSPAEVKAKAITINDVHTTLRTRHTSTPTAGTKGTPSRANVNSTGTATTIKTPWKLPPAPSAALFGLSLIGNLDAVYKQDQYCASPPSSPEARQQQQQLITMHNVTTASRLKPSGLLILSHTFNKKLWMHLCWDVEGFPRSPDSEVEIFWDALSNVVDKLAA